MESVRCVGQDFKQLIFCMILGGIVNSLKDIFFPVNCLNCAKEGAFVCDECFETLDLSGVFCCPICHKETIDGNYCENCQPLFIDKHVAAIKYLETDLIGEIIHNFKYQYVEDLDKIIEKMLKNFFTNKKISDIDIITFVPLHSRRYVERGFNQAEKIAIICGKILNKPVTNLLKRTRYTHPQAQFKRQERLVNLQNAFCLENKKDVFGKNVLVVDDVFTTGSTIQECAKVLKSNKASNVYGFSLARG